MIASTQSKQAAYLASLFVLLVLPAQASESPSAWYYNETLTTPADSRAILRPYQQPAFRQQSLGNQAALKQWSWLKQHNFQRNKAQPSPVDLAPTIQQETALPFWPALKPK